MRRGNQVDFDPSKMLPGEFAVAQDQEHLYLCYRPGRVLEIGSASTLLPYVYEAEAWAKGTKDNVPVSATDPQYHNNSKYYSEQADTSATNAATSETNAATSETNAETSAETSEAWSVGERGGQPVPSTDPAYNNSAKYWAQAAAAIVGIGIATTTTAGIVKPDGTTITVDPDGTIHADNISINGKKVVVS